MENYAIGLDKYELNTPALFLDLDKLDSNIEKMANFFEQRSADLRPHMKTHKTPQIAHKQIEQGAIGITCQKLEEAEVMSRSGIRDMLITNQIIGESKIRRLVHMARSTEVKAAVDNPENVTNISEAAQAKGVNVGLVVELNIGMDRCGVEPGKPALELAQLIEGKDGVKFMGLLGYEGHTVFIEDYNHRREETEKALEKEVETAERIEKDGLACSIVSSGATGTYDITGTYPGVTEVEAGSYATFDAKYSQLEGVGDQFEHAVTLLSTVISRPAKSRAVLDVGMKALSTDFGIPVIASEEGDLKIRKLSEEHGYLQVGDSSRGPEVGEKVEIIPSHGCTTINLHDRFFGTRNGEVESVWPIAARGKFG